MIDLRRLAMEICTIARSITAQSAAEEAIIPILARSIPSSPTGVICAQWTKLSDGCVARCDQIPNHTGDHLDSLIAISWKQEVKPCAQAL